ncbi:MAG: hypothetical protein VXZ81_04905 [Pseudomonadota bacterium]|nr:hypothetical protein [Pseudomonadota bacterium]
MSTFHFTLFRLTRDCKMVVVGVDTVVAPTVDVEGLVEAWGSKLTDPETAAAPPSTEVAPPDTVVATGVSPSFAARAMQIGQLSGLCDSTRTLLKLTSIWAICSPRNSKLEKYTLSGAEPCSRTTFSPTVRTTELEMMVVRSSSIN